MVDKCINWELFPNFKVSEFNGIPNVNLLYILQTVRNYYGKVTITSGIRTQEENDKLPGSIKNSDHLKGCAADFYCNKCKTLKGRKEVIKLMKNIPGFKYAYCNGYKLSNDGKETYPVAVNMGNCIHISCVE